MKAQMSLRNTAVSGVNRANNNNQNSSAQNQAQNAGYGTTSAGQPTSAPNQFDKTFIKIIHGGRFLTHVFK